MALKRQKDKKSPKADGLILFWVELAPLTRLGSWEGGTRYFD